MALPSGVTFASIAFVAASGIGLVAVQAGADEQPTDPSPPPTGTTQSTPSPSAPTDTTPSDAQTKKPEPATPSILVEVYNNSTVGGLADETATRLEEKGWKVAATDNWYGDIPSNTVYYPDGDKAAAEQLARDLGYDRVRAAVSPMSGSRLTVIVVDG